MDDKIAQKILKQLQLANGINAVRAACDLHKSAMAQAEKVEVAAVIEKLVGEIE